MKGNSILLLVLFCFVSVSFSAIKGTNRVVFGVTNGSVISVRDYEILPNGKWDLERSLEITPLGPPLSIAATAPNNNGRFQLMYLYDSNQTFKGRNLSIDFDNFDVVKDAPLSGSFGFAGLGVFQITKNSKNQGRLTFVDSGFDIGTRTIRTGTGNPLKKQLDFFDNDSDYIPVSHSFDWGGTKRRSSPFSSSIRRFFW